MIDHAARYNAFAETARLLDRIMDESRALALTIRTGNRYPTTAYGLFVRGVCVSTFWRREDALYALQRRREAHYAKP